MALTGLNPFEVNNAINNVWSSYEAVVSALVDTNQHTFVVPMSAVWGSPQAVTFFSNYYTVITNICAEVEKVYRSIVASMDSAASNLALLAGSTWTMKELYSEKKELDISCIKEDIGGTIGIDQVEATRIAGELTKIMANVSTALTSAKMAVNTSGFVGGDMQDNLISSLNQIQSNFEEQFSQLQTAVTNAIQETANMYTTESGKISAGFGGGQG